MPKEEAPAATMADYKKQRQAKEGGENRGRLRSVSIEQADNGGFIVRAEYRPADTRNQMWPPSKESVFATWDETAKHVTKLFGKKAEA